MNRPSFAQPARAGVELETARLRLRRLRAEDLEDLTALGNDERGMKWLGGRMSHERTRDWLDRALAHWREHGYGRFVVSQGESFVGVVGFSRTDLDAGIVPGVQVAWRLAPGEIVAVTTRLSARSWRSASHEGRA